ncbi:hypothetical protein CG471_08035 [Sphingobium sp. IP1]|uniref:SGNH/GDSL hydrolase family protein n=1 Tax=Sphingobium sp. IP1 TaxID=2021637 RepID=UPI000C07F965|nr:SGNH/GDSL hydrolase family protein [Sphingobium sp. IP1]PHP20340.1 hypothetical protein CG471_08035 [Sphingobium sp. IP1]
MADIASPIKTLGNFPAVDPSVPAIGTADQIADGTAKVSMAAGEREGLRAQWLAPDALSLTGPASGLTWTSAHKSVARAIRVREVVGYGWDRADHYYIAVFAHGDGAVGDRIIIRRASDNVAVIDTTEATIAKSASGPTRRVIASSSIQITLDIDYHELATGVLVNSATATPLMLAPRLIDVPPAQASRARNIAYDASGALNAGAYQGSGSIPVQVAASAELAALGVSRVHPIGTGTTAASLYKRDALPAQTASKYVVVGALVRSADGTTWPASPMLSIYVYNALSGGSQVSGQSEAIGGHVQISDKVRWYWGRSRLPASGTLASMAYGLNTLAAGAAVEIGGWTAAIAENALSPNAVSMVDWSGYSTRDAWRDSTDSAIATNNTAINARADKLRRGDKPWSNIWPNGNNDPLEAAPIWINGSSTVDPASAEMMARGIYKAVNVGTGGSNRLREAAILNAGSSGQYFVASLYAYASDGVTWPVCGVYWYAGAIYVGGLTMTSYIQIDSTTRLYHVAGQLPDRADLTALRIGVLATVTGTAQIGGWSYVQHKSALTIDDVVQDDWYPAITRRDRLRDIKRQVDTVAKLPFAGETWVYFGDSITESFGVPAAVAALTGATVINGGFGGCRWTPRVTSSEPDAYTNEMSMVRLAERVRTGIWTPLINAADSLFAFNGDDNRPQAAALAATNYANVTRIIMDWGTNDWSAGRAIGAADSASEYDLRGSINLAISRILTAYPLIELALVTPWWRGPAAVLGDSNVNPNVNGVYLSEFQDAIIAAGRRNQVAVLPMHDLFGANLANKATLLGDDLHPTAAGAARKARLVSAWSRAVWKP